MWTAILKVWTTRSIRVAAITIFCLGFTYASTIPYQAIIAINQLGVGEEQFSLLLFAVAVTQLVASFVLGYASDRVAERKRFILMALSIGAVGFGAFALFPSFWTFGICLLFIAPVSGNAQNQIYSVIRTQTNKFEPQDAVSINSVVRAVYSASWILVPGMVGLFIASRENVSDSFAVAALAYILCFAIYAAFGSSVKNTEKQSLTAWNGFKEALRLVTRRRILFRLIALALVSSPIYCNIALLPLFITRAHGGGTTDVGLIAGFIAGLEIPFMLLGGYFSRKYEMWKILVGAGIIYAIYFLCLGASGTLQHIYAIAPINAAGAAILLSMPISYWQNLLPEKPGLATSLLSINVVLSKSLGALVFALSGTATGLSGAAWMACVIGICGCCLLTVLERGKVALAGGI